MNKINAVVKMYFTDKFTWFYLPWIILFGSFGINLLISVFVEEPMYTGGGLSIFIYMFVSGIIVLVQNFPFAIGLSISRKDFFLGTIVAMTLVSMFTGVILYLLLLIEKHVIIGWGTELHFFNLPYVNEGSMIEKWVVNVGLIIHLFFAGMIISSLYRRFGKNGLFAFFTIVALILTVVVYSFKDASHWVKLWNWLIDHTMFQVVLWSLPLTIIYAMFSYLLVRRAKV